MEWLKKLIHKLFAKNKHFFIEETKNNIEYDKEDFIIDLKQHANAERNDGNGYKIIKNLKLEEMI